MISLSTTVRFTWVKCLYQGERAKYVKAHIDRGIGYIFMKGDNKSILAAHKHVGILQHYMTPLTYYEIEKVERIEKKRNGK